MFYFDPMYFLFMIPGLIIALFAQAKVKSNFNKYSRITSYRNITGSEAARRILEANGISDVRIERCAGSLSDHYDPRDNTVYLSETVYASCSIASIGVAAHEVGHAVQYAKGYSPIKLRSALVPVCNFGSSLSPILIIGGYLLQIDALLYLALLVFALAFLFQLVTLPVEFNASNRALKAIDSYDILEKDEIKGARKVLSAAALTYVAALIQSFLILLYYFVRISGRRN